jgi:hypothetical protein
MLVSLLTLGPAVATAESAGADTGRTESAEYKRVISRGLQEFELGNYPEARAAFSEAHKIFPNARTHRALGLVAYELRNYSECLEQLSRALSSKEKPLGGELRKSTEELLARTQKLVGRVLFELTPATASVLVNGVSVQLGHERRLTLEVGDHLLEMRAEGYLPERQKLSVRGGEELRVAVALRPSEPLATQQSPGAVTSQPAQPSDSDRSGKRRWYKSPWLWTAVAVVIVGTGVGVGLALRPDADTKVKASTGTENTPPGGVLQALRSW